ncbi:xylosyltransferase oxt-like [Eriocheir sinensis]|uniref:xylosyltransferase oxt-like n=1 Tax=Eriocheir sinensis TaxID=95602 RepID=UPI0021CA5B58|nr:xylosyltransferase oxt-like [Eriocheir sinensis]
MAAVVPARAVLLVTLNILRVLCRKYGLYLALGLTLVLLQGYSGYQGLRRAREEPQEGELGRALPSEDASKSQVDVESRVYQVDKGDADSHNKGPPDPVEASSQELSRDWLGIDLPCTIRSRESLSAIKRATTDHCKALIANITCHIQAGTFYPKRLQSSCPSNGKVRGKYMGCFMDSRENRILRGHAGQLRRNTPNLCCDICFQRGYMYAGVEYGKECFCGNEDLPLQMKASDNMCGMACSGDAKFKCGDYLYISIYQTGLAKYTPVALKGSSTHPANKPVRIAFVLTVNGRAIRQLRRLVKALYHRDHYFFIHVDSRQEYMYREVLKLEEQYSNIRVSRYRLSTIWGGASLLKILLHCMVQITHIKEWDWDFVINLSESDYPIKKNEELVTFLTNNKERNFLKSHGHDTNKFLQKQGLDRTFLECENHMWRIGERHLPLGIRVDGGSDWLCLNRAFVDYVVTSQSQLVRGLKKVYSYTLLPAESFFHTVLRNSEFCQSFTDNNLHITNWKRKLGCKCQYKHIVDWCGCSPNDFTPSDWGKLEGSTSRNLFFARKFEAVISQAIINQVDGWLYTPYYTSTPGLENYWENRYHHEDMPQTSMDVGLTLHHSGARLSTRAVGQLATTSRNKCEVYATTVLTAHSYHHSDTLKGVLIEYAARADDATFHLETWIFPHVKYMPPFEKPNHRLTDLEVGTDFDVKEQVFRNFGVPLGPNSDVTVVTRWSADVAVEEQAGEEDSLQHPHLVLADPTMTLVAEEFLTLESGEQILPHTFTLRKPLLPGAWTVRVIIDGAAVASHAFLVLPQQFIQGRQISVQKARELHRGPSEPYTDDDLSHLTALLSLSNPGNASAKEMISHHSNLYGPQLSQWIDELVSRFYTIQDSCYVDSEQVPECVRFLLDSCSHSSWSSLAPDPKADLGEVDARTGRISDPYRIGNREF